VRLEGTRMGSAVLMHMTYYKELYSTYPMWFHKFILHVVSPVITWVHIFNIR